MRPVLAPFCFRFESDGKLLIACLKLYDKLGVGLYSGDYARLLEARSSLEERIFLEHAFRCHLDAVRLFLSRGADPNAVLSGPDNSVMRICGRVIRLLIDSGGVASKCIAEMSEMHWLAGDCAETNGSAPGVRHEKPG